MRPGFDPTLYLVTDTAMCGERGVPATVAAAVAGGVTMVQLRDPHADARTLTALAAELVALLAGTGVAFVVNDRVDVALAAGADGVHLGQRDLPVAEARRLAGADFIIGLSTSNREQIDAVNALPAGLVDYIGIGPIFATATKPDAAAPVGVAALAGLAARSSVPAVAIGGIKAANLTEVAGAGAAGAAVVSEICAADDPRAAAARLREIR